MTSSVITKQPVKYVFPWMFGQTVDVLFFFVPVLLGIAFFFLAESASISASPVWTLIVVDAFGAGPFHWGPTWFAYFDKKNRQYWESIPSKRLIFYAGPPLILLTATVLNVVQPWTIQLVTMVWGIQHLVQQNIGILLLYHNHGRGEAIVDRKLEIGSQHAPTILFSVIFFHRFLLHSPQHLFWTVLFAGGALWAGYYICAYLIQMWKQVRDGASLNVPAFVFWFMSAFALLPFAFFGKSFADAFVIPVTIHWFQYIGLNYVLVRNKYTGENSQAENLPRMSPMMLFFATCSIFLGLWAALSLGSTIFGATGVAMQICGGIVLGMANCHYFADAFLWRFRESYARETILPFLKSSKNQVKAQAQT